jgi:hypothetical protein
VNLHLYDCTVHDDIAVNEEVQMIADSLDSTLLIQEIAHGQGLSLPKLARNVGTNPSTAFRWATKGFPDGRGGSVRLECLRKGRQFITTQAAYARMLAALPRNTSDITPSLVSRPPSIASRERDKASAAEQVSRRLGM